MIRLLNFLDEIDPWTPIPESNTKTIIILIVALVVVLAVAVVAANAIKKIKKKLIKLKRNSYK